MKPNRAQLKRAKERRDAHNAAMRALIPDRPANWLAVRKAMAKAEMVDRDRQIEARLRAKAILGVD